MLCAVIMAGGKGTRFWPQSTEERPKQFLKLVSDKTMLQMTFDRINKKIDKDHIFICTSEQYKDLVLESIPDFKIENIILEPSAKNTAPCILLSTLYVDSIYPNSSIITLASDALISDEDSFIEKVNEVDSFISMNDGILTLGITPTRPEVGYGYIKYEKSDSSILKVEEFKEKPTYEKALEYVTDGGYLWNAGIFAFQSSFILKEFKKYLLKEFEALSNVPFDKKDKKYYKRLKEAYETCSKISFDTAIAEKSEQIYTTKANFGWDDIGTWASLKRYVEEDSLNNIFKGEVEAIHSSGNIVYTNDKKVILLDVNNIFCIDSNDVIVIGNKDKIDEVHTLRK